MNEATNETAKNYTDEMVAEMVDQYTAEPTRVTVEALAVTFGKTTRSIIAKLSREGVYVAQKPATKSGAPVVRKQDDVTDISTLLGVDFGESLTKASKDDLVKLRAAIQLAFESNTASS